MKNYFKTNFIANSMQTRETYKVPTNFPLSVMACIQARSQMQNLKKRRKNDTFSTKEKAIQVL